MNNLPPRLEKYDREGWFRYLSRAVNLKNAPNPDLDMNTYRRCIVGRSRMGAIYHHIKSDSYCKTCRGHATVLNEKYGALMERKIDSVEFGDYLNYFFDHMEKAHAG